MKVLALDIATRTGWAVDGPSGPLAGSKKFHTYGLDYGTTYAAFDAWLTEMIMVHRPQCIAFEAPLVFGGRDGTTRETNVHTVRRLLGMVAVTEKVAAECQIRAFEATNQQIRKHFVGHGRADKHVVIRRCLQLGWAVQDDNAADALALWDYARHRLRVPGCEATAFQGSGL